VPTDNLPRTLAITIKAGKGGLPSEAARLLAERIGQIIAEAGYAAHIQEVVGGGELYIGTRPDKRQRLAEIEALLPTLTSLQIAARLGLTERQVYRYRALLKNIGTD
jgi:hypothetical protein